MIPKLPLSGLNSYISTEVLVGKGANAHQKDGAGISLKSQASKMPNSARVQRQLVLPSLPGTGSRAVAAMCLSARGNGFGQTRMNASTTTDWKYARGVASQVNPHRLVGLSSDDGCLGDPELASRRLDSERPTREYLEQLGVPLDLASLVSSDCGSSCARSLAGGSKMPSLASLTSMQPSTASLRSLQSFGAQSFDSHGASSILRQKRLAAQVHLKPLLETTEDDFAGSAEPWKIERLQACFFRSEGEIKARLKQIDEYHHGIHDVSGYEVSQPPRPGKSPRRASQLLQPMPPAILEAFPELKELQDAFEGSGIEKLELKPRRSWYDDFRTRVAKVPVVQRRDSRMMMVEPSEAQNDDAQDEEGPSSASSTRRKRKVGSEHDMLGADFAKSAEDEISRAWELEVVRASEFLAFVRWLCGLPEARLEDSLSTACDIFAQVLLPRQKGDESEVTKGGGNIRNAGTIRFDRLMAAGAGMEEGGIKGLGKVITGMLEARPSQVSVVHSEGSIFSAVQQGLFAAFARPWPVPATSLPQLRFFSQQQQMQLEKKMRDAQREEHLHQLLEFQRQHTQRPPYFDYLHASIEIKDEIRLSKRATVVAPKQSNDVPRWPEALRPLWPLQDFLRRPEVERRKEFQWPSSEDATDGIKACGVGDPQGTLALRRLLLARDLTAFGASRRQDTCILWTSPSPQPQRREGSHSQIDAICYPPTGFVPHILLNRWQTAWSISPDCRKYSPTLNTNVKIWRVKIQHASGLPRDVERIAEVPVKGLLIDCSVFGEPFCVVFWPDVGNPEMVRVSLEVQLGGLRGPQSELSFYYEVLPFRQNLRNSQLRIEASKFAEDIVEDASLWPCKSPRAAKARRTLTSSSSTNRISSKQKVTTSPRAAISTGNRADKFLSAACLLEPLSHPNSTLEVHGVDVKMTLRGGSDVHAVRAELYVVRFGGEEEFVRRATQVTRLQDGIFLVRCKIPLPRFRYYLRLWPAPNEVFAHPLQYNVSVIDAAHTPALLPSLEDPLISKFGFAPISAAAQALGIIPVAPRMFRVPVGECYFLIYVDKAIALAAMKNNEDENEMNNPHCAPRLHTRLFNRRLGMKDNEKRSLSKSQAAKESSSPFNNLKVLQKSLQRRLSPAHVQDSVGTVHLDLSFNEGSCVKRLTERSDLPGFYETFLDLNQADLSANLRLFLRLPGTDACHYTPRLLCEWFICRSNEHLPTGFV